MMKTKLYIAAVIMAGLLIYGEGVYAFPGPGGFNGTGSFGNSDNHGGFAAKMLRFGGSSFVVGSDGTSYIASLNAVDNATTLVNATSKLLAITSSGTKQSITLNGIVRKLVIGQDASSNNYLVAVAVVKSSAAASPSTVLYIVSLPFSQSVTPVSVSLNGAKASRPEIVNGNVYITTTVWTAGTSGSAATKTSYLNVVKLNGTIVSQVQY
ncbi:MAG: hypothetical protein HQK99_13790 [Nitrospirae bacterium]|nr:hypothetical protein [Nitrospirota bacterium]